MCCFIEIGVYLRRQSRQKRRVCTAFSACGAKPGDCTSRNCIEERVKTDKKFHDELIKISGNNLLGILNDALSDIFEMVISQVSTQVQPEEWKELSGCHRKICENLEKKDVQEGIKVIREHYNVLNREIGKRQE